jgi:hypothetical protein
MGTSWHMGPQGLQQAFGLPLRQDGKITDVDAYLDNCGLSLLSDKFESPLGFHLYDTMVLALDLCLVILIHDVILDALNP